LTFSTKNKKTLCGLFKEFFCLVGARRSRIIGTSEKYAGACWTSRRNTAMKKCYFTATRRNIAMKKCYFLATRLNISMKKCCFIATRRNIARKKCYFITTRRNIAMKKYCFIATRRNIAKKQDFSATMLRRDDIKQLNLFKKYQFDYPVPRPREQCQPGIYN
jgi:hypothetical protein